MNSRLRLIRFFSLISLVMCAIPLRAELRTAAIFADRAVLQREQPVSVWGWGTPGAAVNVEFGGQRITVRCSEEGEWLVKLAPMPASDKGRELTVSSGSERLVFEDILVGEVWLAAGQSNMNHWGPDRDVGIYPFYQSPKGKDLPDIRISWYGAGVSLDPLPDVPDYLVKAVEWKTFSDFEARGANMSLYFARVLRDRLEVPVGIIQVAVSGTNQAAWMSRESLESFPASKAGMSNFFEEFMALQQDSLAKKGGHASFESFKAKEQAWIRNPSGNWPGRGNLALSQFPSVLYNTRVYPLRTYGMRGVIWHQGEAGPGGDYAGRLVAMFRQWREQFDQNLVLIWGTLSRHTPTQPPLNPRVEGFYRSGTSRSLRTAYDLFKGDLRVEVVEIYDLGNHDTHFEMKAEGGRRYALAALRVAYGVDAGPFSGPRPVSARVRGNEVVLTYDLVGEGLVYRPGINGVSGFYVLGGGKPAWGQVRQMDGRTLTVRHPEGHALDRVEYGASPNPHETLFNSDGLPGSPFSNAFTDAPAQNVEDAFPLVQQEENQGRVNIMHIRRGGYRFIIRRRDPKEQGISTVRLWVPKEWEKMVVESGDQELSMEPLVIDGERFLKVDVPVNRSVLIADTRVLDEMRKENRF